MILHELLIIALIGTRSVDLIAIYVPVLMPMSKFLLSDTCIEALAVEEVLKVLLVTVRVRIMLPEAK